MSEQLEKRKQAALQCKALVQMLTSISTVHNQLQEMLENGDGPDSLVEMAGRQSSALMEDIGNWMNAMDIVTEKDDWITPVILRAQELWPVVRGRARSHAVMAEAQSRENGSEK